MNRSARPTATAIARAAAVLPAAALSRAVALLCCGLVLGLSGAARAELTIRITGGAEAAQPIAIVPFGVGVAGQPPIALHDVIASDLRSTGQFEPVARNRLPALPASTEQVNFEQWRSTGAPHLVIGRVDQVGTGEGADYRIEFRVFDVLNGRQLAGFRVRANEAQLRRRAHQMSDVIYQAITGMRGAFDTRIAYVSETGRGDGRRYALVVADSDGFNPRSIYRSDAPLMSPNWSPDGTRLAYVSYETGKPRVIVQEVASGKRDVLTKYPRLNAGPVWAPDGRRIAMTLSKDGNPEIYVIDVATKRPTRITRNRAIDTEAAWSPDGRSLVFTSNRGGGPQLYRVASTGGSAQRLTFDGAYNSRGRFSPDGSRIAFVHQASGGGFRIASLELSSGRMQVLTDSRFDESPSFAPNGSVIIYATQGSRGAVLASVSVDGEVKRELSEQRGRVREPAWSPFRAQ